MSGVIYDKILGRLREGGEGGGGGQGTTPKIVTVDDITDIDQDILDGLNAGDIVLKHTTNELHTYIVVYHSEEKGEISLVYADAENVEEVYYEYDDEQRAWAHIVTTITRIADLANKANKVPSPTSGDFAGLDSNGNITDSGYKASDFATAAQGAKADTAIQDISGKADKVLVASSQPVGGMLPNKLYNLGTLSAPTTFAMAAATDNTIANVWMWTFETGATDPTITWPQQITMWADGSAPTIEGNKHYQVNVMNGLACVVSGDIPQPANE